MEKKINVNKLVVVGMLAALAYISLLIIRIPILPTASFLRFDIKDIFIVIGGFFYGPIWAFAIAVVVAFLQMLTISEYGFIGLVMNVISSTAFACTASAVYKNRENSKSAVVGLVIGCMSMISIMLLWNFFISPLYMGVSRDVVANMLLSVFLPFNSIKSVLNAAITIVVFRPIMSALYFTNIKSDKNVYSKGIWLVSAFIIVSGAMLIMILQGTI